jgi:hypothetical protein
MMQEHSAAHFVVAVVDGNPPGKPARLVTQLIERLRPTGEYAVTVLHEAAGPAVHCAFEVEDDADKLATAMHARGIGRSPGWALQRSFRLDAEVGNAIAAALAGRGEIDQR